MHPVTPDQRNAISRIERRFRKLGFRTAVSDGETEAAKFVLGNRVVEPHVAVMEGSDLVRWVLVETRSSMSAGVVERWSLGAFSRTPLWVYVPKGLYGEAFRLIVEHGLRASILEYDDQNESDRSWPAAPMDARIA